MRQQLAQTWYFQPSDSIRRVVTIASPHRGSDFSNGTTQWLARKVDSIPGSPGGEHAATLFLQNEDLRNSDLLRINNERGVLSALLTGL